MNQSTELNLNELPAAPQLLLRLIDLMTCEDVNFDELDSLISRDGVLSAKVLSIATSAAYRQWNDTPDLRKVLVVLGTRAITTLAVTTAVHQFFSGHSQSQDKLDELWLNALLMAHTSRRISEVLAYKAPAEAHLVGLMHGLGQVILLTRHPQVYRDLLQQSAEGARLQDLERQQFGVSNTELAAEAFAQWALDPLYQQAVLYQDAYPDTVADMPLLVRIVNLAARASATRRQQRSEDQHSDDQVDDRFFGINQMVVDDLLRESEEAALSEAASFGIGSRTTSAGTATAHDRDAVQLQLARRVHRIALLGAGSAMELYRFDDNYDMLAALNRQLALIFGFHRAQFYLLDDDTGRLAPCNFLPSGNPLPTHEIEYGNGGSLAARSLACGDVLSLDRQQASNHPSALDRQLLAALGDEAVLSIPLATDRQPVGVIIVGCSQQESASLDARRELLLHYGKACAQAILQLRTRQRDSRLNLQLQQQSQELINRSLVHEASSPLTVISNYLELLRSRVTAPEDQSDIELIQQEIVRISRLLTQFRDASAGMREADTIDLNEVVRQVVALLEPSLFGPRQLRVELELDSETPALRNDSGAVRQILTNLLSNASDALTAGGLVRIITRAISVVDQTAYCELVVSDNGPGIPRSLVPHIFSPIESPKGGDHEGLGLTIVYQLVKRLDGTIRYRTADGGGAEFTILIPIEKGT